MPPPMYSSPHPYGGHDVDWNPAPEDSGAFGNPYPNVGGGGGGGGYAPGYDAHLWTGEAEPRGYASMPYSNRAATNESRGRSGRDKNPDEERTPWDEATPEWGPGAQDKGPSRRRDARDKQPQWDDDARENLSGWGDQPAGWNAANYKQPRQRRQRHRSRPERDDYRDNEDPMNYYHHDRPRRTERGWPEPEPEPAGWYVGPEPPRWPDEREPSGWPDAPGWNGEPDDYGGEPSWPPQASGGGGADINRGVEPSWIRSGGHSSSPPPLMDNDYDHHGHHDGPPDEPPPLGGPAGGPRRPRSAMKHRRAFSADHLPRTYGYYDSGSSYTSDSLRAAQLQYGAAAPAATLQRNGSGLKKAMRWLKRPITTSATDVTLHPLLRTSSLLRPPSLRWDVSRAPLHMRGGVPISGGPGFGDPATSPPTTYMRLLIPIPGLPDAHWVCQVNPAELGPPSSPNYAGSPYAFHEPSFADSPFQYMAQSVPVVTTAALLLALHSALQRRATQTEFLSLTQERRTRVSTVFWARCRRAGGVAEADAEASKGVRRIDFLMDKTRWEGLVPAREMDVWIVRLGRP